MFPPLLPSASSAIILNKNGHGTLGIKKRPFCLLLSFWDRTRLKFRTDRIVYSFDVDSKAWPVSDKDEGPREIFDKILNREEIYSSWLPAFTLQRLAVPTLFLEKCRYGLFQELKLGFWCSFTIYSKFLSCMRSPEFRTIAPNCLVLTLSIFLITPPISPPLCFIVFGAMIRFFYASSYFNFYNEIAPPPHIIIPLISQVTPIKNMRNKWVVSCRYRYDNDAVLIEIGRSELIIGMGNK